MRGARRLMANRKAPVTQAEAKRYFKALREAGYGAGRIVIEKPDGTRITLVAGKASEAAPDDADDIDAMIERVPHASTP